MALTTICFFWSTVGATLAAVGDANQPALSGKHIFIQEHVRKQASGAETVLLVQRGSQQFVRPQMALQQDVHQTIARHLRSCIGRRGSIRGIDKLGLVVQVAFADVGDLGLDALAVADQHGDSDAESRSGRGRVQSHVVISHNDGHTLRAKLLCALAQLSEILNGG